MSWNLINGKLPDDFGCGNLNALEVLNLSQNDLCGDLDAGNFSQLKYLRVLDLSDNFYTGE